VRFVPHPSVSVLRSRFAVDAIWRAALEHDDRALAALDPDCGSVHLLVHRVAGEVEVRRLDEAAWRFAAALFGGEPLAAAIEVVPDKEDVPALLAAHLSAGDCVAFSACPEEGLQ
jgi:hypothetical protein